MTRTPESIGAANQATGLVTVTLDQEYDPPLVAILVPSSGDVNVVAWGDADADAVLISGFSGILPCFVRKVLTTSTTATGIIGLRG